MLKTLIGGIAVGLANIIPGVSGGTMMVVLGLFNRVMSSISGIFTKKNPNRLDDIKFLATVLIGAMIGLVVFANVLEWCFGNYPTQTMFGFVGMVAFSIPSLVRSEMKEDERLNAKTPTSKKALSILGFGLGCVIIFGMMLIAPEEKELVITSFPALDLVYLLKMVLIGFVAGFAMFIPGVSGSMCLLIIGEYYLFKSLLANVTSFDLQILIPLAFMGVGILLGIVASSKITGYCLKHFHNITIYFILGLVIASSIVLIPLDATYDMMMIISCFITMLVGGIIVVMLEKLA